MSRQRSRQYCFTINNYTDEDIIQWNNLEKTYGTKILWIYGLEIGEDKKTPHIQGYICFENPRDFKSLKKDFPKAHIEKAKGNKKQNFDYCKKDNNYKTNMAHLFINTHELSIQKVLELEYKNVKWHPYQEDILNKLNGPVDKRKIFWYWEEKGNVGKSYLVKYICIKYNVIIGEGKMTDIFNQINTMMIDKGQKKGKIPSIIIIDVPRTSHQYINYAMIEKVKNGCIYSGKYEGGICIFPIPHIVVFANEKPDIHALSSDRLDISEIIRDEGGILRGGGN